MTHTYWTTKHAKAAIFDTELEAQQFVRSLMGHHKTLGYTVGWSSSQHGYVIHNAAGTRMLAVR